MFALLQSLFTPEADHLPTGPDRDRHIAYLAYLRDANPFAVPCR